MKTANCPSCGAPVAFRSSASVYAVCEFCRSTLLRDGEDLKNLGRMADLMDDPSRIQLGSEGRYRGVHFAVIGRIQLRHEAGLWNEWHILFDDQRSAWLSEAGGEYVVSARVPVDASLPAFEALVPEMNVDIAGRSFQVTDLETARCIAGEGELPFKVESGYDVNTADLRGNDRFVTIDYSESPPLVFSGYPASFAELNLANLREKPAPSSGGGATIRAQAFNCPHCAAPLKVHSGAIESVACESCGSILGIENEKVQILARAAQSMRIEPWLPLGSKGRLDGVEWEAIGYLRRAGGSGADVYSWSEYLLFNEVRGFAWLTEYQGHWCFARTLSNPPSVARGQYEFRRGPDRFRLFSSGRAEVTYVVGEFYWRVAVGETCLVEDYVCPPKMLSREVSDKEATWSESEYLEPEALAEAFAIRSTLPARIGVFANQPNPLIEPNRRIFRLFLGLGLVATLVQLAFYFFFSAQTVVSQTLVLSPFNPDATLATREFTLGSRARSLRVTHRTDLDNNWAEIVTTLIEKKTGSVHQGVLELSHYRGVEDGESWTEGTREDSLVFRDLPPGTYYFNVEYELGKDSRAAVANRFEAVRDPLTWSNYVIVMIFLLVFPLVSRWRSAAFESRRWAESDLGGDGDAASDDGDDGSDGGDD